jgi:hypothetical protein
LSEAVRCFKELTTVRIQDITEKAADAKVATTTKAKNEIDIDDVMQKLIDLCKRGKTEMLRSYITSNVVIGNDPSAVPQKLSQRLPDSHGTTLLHIASSNSHPATIALLLSLGADPTMREQGGQRNLPYDVADDKEVRDAFRRAYAADMTKWDWEGAAGVPSPLTPEMEEQQKEREKEKKRKQKERQKSVKEAVGAAVQAAAIAEQKEVAIAQEKKIDEITRAKKASLLNKLGQSQRESIGMTPEKRAQLDREKRY